MLAGGAAEGVNGILVQDDGQREPHLTLIVSLTTVERIPGVKP